MFLGGLTGDRVLLRRSDRCLQSRPSDYGPPLRLVEQPETNNGVAVVSRSLLHVNREFDLPVDSVFAFKSPIHNARSEIHRRCRCR